MIISYDKDRDYIEIFFKREEKYGDDLNDLVTVFKSEKNDEVVGYTFEEASQSLFASSLVSSSAKLAALLRIIRSKQGLTQEEAAKKIHGLTFRHYQRIESGEENPTLETIDSMRAGFPSEDFSLILKHPAKAS